MAPEEGGKASTHDSERSCWDCRYQNINQQDTFLGVCTWFSKHGMRDKQIPPHKVDTG